MDAPLDPIAVRVLGSLIEKQITTPDYYPLTLNALVAACNQTSNRDPVLQLDEETVRRAINDLRVRSLARGVQSSGSRVMKYSHLLDDKLELDPPELAVMCVLMLRGVQTPGEIKTRGTRLFEFSDLEQVERTLEALAARQPSPLVTALPRRPGQKETRYAHLLSGEVAVEATSAPESAAPRATVADARLESMERTIDALRTELAELRVQFEAFRRGFE